MFSTGSFAPLYAEEYLDVGTGTNAYGEQEHQYQFGTRSQNPSSNGYSDVEQPSKSPPREQQAIRPLPARSDYPRKTSTNSSDDPTSTGSSSTSDDRLFGTESNFEDGPYVRRLSSSATSFAQRTNQNSAVASSPGSIRSNSSRQGDVSGANAQPIPSADELASRDRQLLKLTKKLDKMHRRVVDLEVDLQCQDLETVKHSKEGAIIETLLKVEQGKDDPIGIEVGGPQLVQVNSNSSSEEEKQDQEDTPAMGDKSSIGPEARRLIHKLLSDYEDVERLYKEEKFQHARHMRNLSLRRTSGSLVGIDIDETSQVSARYGTCDSRQAAFKPILQEEMRYSHIAHPPRVSRTGSSLSGTSRGARGAPDPPEELTKYCQPHHVHPQFMLFHGQSEKRRDDDDDRHSDDLSSKAVDTLIDDEVNSDCHAVKDHQGEGRQYWRDIILGVNDGLVSTFLLVAGVRGGGMSSSEILLTAIAGSVAGAVSMCAGEYVATKSQNEVIAGEIATETRHVRDYQKDELKEVSDLLELIGIDDRALQKRLIRHYARDSKALLKIMIALELGFLEEEERSPAMAGLVSFFLFLAGAFPSVMPFMIPDVDPTVGFIAAGVSTCIALLVVGAVKTWATKGNCLTAALENLCVAGFGGAIAYGAGLLSIQFIET